MNDQSLTAPADADPTAASPASVAVDRPDRPRPNRSVGMTSKVSGALRRMNPVFDRELRQRSRNGRSLVVMIVFLLLALGVAYLSYLGETANQSIDPFSVLSQSVGRTMFEWVMILELVLLLFVVPGLSAGAITGERDRQTLIPLQVTMVGPTGIFLGKVLSSSSFVLLLIVASTPIMAVAYLLGGITIPQVLTSMMALIMIGFLLAVIGVACSSLTRGTAASTLFAYGFSLLITIGTLVAFGAMMITYISFVNDDFNAPPKWMALPFSLNPFVALAAPAGDINDNFTSPWPLSGIKQAMLEWDRGGGNGGINEAAVGDDWFGLKLWLYCMAGLGSLSLLMAWRGIRRLRTPAEVVRQ